VNPELVEHPAPPRLSTEEEEEESDTSEANG